jgi:hypothetical protein
LGFCAAAGLAAAIFACVLLLPEYASLARVRHELLRQEAVNAELAELIQAHDRLIAALPEDPVLTKRLAMDQLGLWPEDELVVPARDGSRLPPPGMALTSRHPRPEPPTGWVMDAARRVSKPGTKRGLLLLAAIALIAAICVFPAREDRRKTHTSPHWR